MKHEAQLFKVVRWMPWPLTAALLLGSSQLSAQPPTSCSATSPVHTVALAELYTSEGCSSCPPADRWLSDLVRDPASAARVIGLGLHVDYWDYISWKDEFASPGFTQRQRDWAQAQRTRFVYTPQIVLSGGDYRNWAQAGVAADIQLINLTAARANLKITAMPTSNVLAVTGTAKVSDPALRANTRVYLALTQGNISTPVKRGENKGVTLKHDNVVRDWQGPFTVLADGTVTIEKRLAIPKNARLNDLRLVLFAQRGAEILQAVALPLVQAGCAS